MKKICIVSPDSYPLLAFSKENQPVGGAETQLVTLGKSFAEKGYRIFFVVDDFGQDQKIELLDSITIIKSPLRYMGGSNRFLFPDWLKLTCNLVSISADIHILKLPNHLLFPIGLFCKIFKKRLFFICQIDEDVVFFPLKTKKVEYRLYRLGLKMTDYVIAQNIKQLNGIKKIYTGHCALIRNILSFKESGKFNKENFILWVGSNLPRKQPELFIQLAESLPSYRFVMIVSKSKQFPDVGKLIEACAGVSNLKFIGGVPFNEINCYFKKASLLVSTSRSEGFPNVFLQAWQCSTPVISLNIDPDDIITKYSLGRVSSDIIGLKSYIISLMEDNNLRDQIGENCLEYIEKNHSTERVTNEYCKLFDNVS